jgi:hypothetical protein
VGLWRSWERASMAWKRSSVRTRPGPPNSLLAGMRLPRFVEVEHRFPVRSVADVLGRTRPSLERSDLARRLPAGARIATVPSFFPEAHAVSGAFEAPFDEKDDFRNFSAAAKAARQVAEFVSPGH